MSKHGDHPKEFFVMTYGCWRNGKRYHVGDYHRGMSPPLASIHSPLQLTFGFMHSGTA